MPGTAPPQHGVRGAEIVNRLTIVRWQNFAYEIFKARNANHRSLLPGWNRSHGNDLKCRTHAGFEKERATVTSLIHHGARQ
jgi:hypothetical protein